MISRLKIKPNPRYYIRCLSEKPPENDANQKEIKQESKKKGESLQSSTEKIQSLLKSMMVKPIISESEYREKFTTAPDRVKRPIVDEIEVKTEKIEENITKAAGEVARAIGGNVSQTEAELLSKVLGKINQSSTSLSDLIVGMKVDRSKDSDDHVKPINRGQQVQRLVQKSQQDVQRTRYNARKQQAPDDKLKPKSIPTATTVNIFTGEPLGIFKAGEVNYGTKLDVWEHLSQRELNLATSQPPANYFQKMILWTEEGKVWKFPIDNEQGMEEERDVHFSEHIFLDSHLEGWCPTKGPIRHFMELVCVGLSKNAFYTAKEKKDHILWYKEYFEAKKDLLTEIGAWEVRPAQEVST